MKKTPNSKYLMQIYLYGFCFSDHVTVFFIFAICLTRRIHTFSFKLWALSLGIHVSCTYQNQFTFRKTNTLHIKMFIFGDLSEGFVILHNLPLVYMTIAISKPLIIKTWTNTYNTVICQESVICWVWPDPRYLCKRYEIIKRHVPDLFSRVFLLI